MLFSIVSDIVLGKILLALFAVVFFFAILYRVIYGAVLKAIRDSKVIIEQKEHSVSDSDSDLH